MPEFKKAIIVHEDPWERQVFADRYLVTTRRETHLTDSGLLCGVRVSTLFDLEPPDPTITFSSTTTTSVVPVLDATTLNKMKNDLVAALAARNKNNEIAAFLAQGNVPFYALELIVDNKANDTELSGKNVSESLRFIANLPGSTNFINRKFFIRSQGISNDIPEEYHPLTNTIQLDGSAGSICLGNNGKDGDLFIQNQQGLNVFHARSNHDNHGGQLYLKDKDSNNTVEMRGDIGELRLGNNGHEGNLHLKNKIGKTVVQVFSTTDTQSGQISLNDENGTNTISLNGNLGAFSVGNNGHDGVIYLKDSNNNTSLHLQGGAGKITAGFEEVGGVIEIRKSKSAAEPGRGGITRPNNKNSRTILLDGDKGDIIVGGDGIRGNILVHNDKDQETIKIDGWTAGIQLGGKACKADGQIILMDSSGNQAILLSGSEGDIILSNADCAEEFDINEENKDVDPGTVMVLNESGQLTVSAGAYDKKVAGIISGAGDYKPGIVLDRQPSQHKRLPVALMGKVYCKVDAAFGPIEVGDLLTTSPTSGHAMKADDPLKAFGAVVGKALRGLTEGQGLIPVLVSLQ